MSGFTGVHLANELRLAGYDVFGTVVRGAESSDALFACDLTVPTDVQWVVEAVGPDYVVHLAALSFVIHADQEAFYRVNLFGTLNLLEAIRRAGVAPRKVLIASSANVYGNPGVEGIDETVCPQPVNHYAASKLAMEHMAATWFDRLPIVITRPFNYTGPGQDLKFLIPKIVSHFVRRESRIDLGNLDVEREFSDVRLVCRNYRLLLESAAAGEIFNVCSGRAYSLRYIL